MAGVSSLTAVVLGSNCIQWVSDKEDSSLEWCVHLPKGYPRPLVGFDGDDRSVAPVLAWITTFP